MDLHLFRHGVRELSDWLKTNGVKGDIVMTVPQPLFDELNKLIGELLSHFPSEPATEIRLYGRIIIRPQ